MRGKLAAVNRTVKIRAIDDAFDRTRLIVAAGETVRFVIRNDGEAVHEFAIGTTVSHQDRREQLAEIIDHGGLFDSGEHVADVNDPHDWVGPDRDNAVFIPPSEERAFIWTFARANFLEFACNIPGHYEAGMVGDIEFESDEGKD
jgi:uncharacterized cupredoxin-like copper-binding protein